LRTLRTETLPAWIDEQVHAVAWDAYDLVGFSSTYDQNLAVLALAGRLAEEYPGLAKVFGGANFDGEMGPELMRSYPCIDYVITGEADLALPAFAARLSAGQSPADIPGVWVRSADGTVSGSGATSPVRDMDALATPDYDDYFAALDRLGSKAVLGGTKVSLVYEASRGCWWGEKHHCTFCGLNALGMTFRSKSPARVLAELKELTSRHRVLDVAAVDNIIDHRYLTSVCADLRETGWDLRLFFEVKANLNRSQLQTLRQAGINAIQPGIESLNSHVLTLMRKGSTMLTNVRLLKWSRFYGIDVAWNILAGFPGETDADYEQQLALVPTLQHLQPPSGVGRIWLERFSPYFTGDYPIHDVRPEDAYRFVYPQPDIALERIAYYFAYRAEGVASREVRDRLRDAVRQWRARWDSDDRPRLTYQRGPDWITFIDTRGETGSKVTVDGWGVDVYEFCDDKPHSIPRILQHLSDKVGVSVSARSLSTVLDVYLAKGLMVCDDGKYLSIALPQEVHRITAAAALRPPRAVCGRGWTRRPVRCRSSLPAHRPGP